MATYYPPPAAHAARPMQYAAQAMAAPVIPAGTFAPGTKVQVGGHRVVIERYLSEGGFAHVYVVRVPTANGGVESAVLKRVAVPDKEALANMRTEVETMKKLKGHGHIVTYIDSHASQLKGGGYEVFLLMEFCEGGGLIDFMNTRLKNRLTEPEILKIFSDAAEGVACMHYLKPPLLHRDIKVENILISSSGSAKYYKLCDFGSSAPPRPAATTAAEGRLIEEDVQKHTTLQYRSPEMIDVYRKRPIDEKSDIWALGVFLYKLCYYTTPFEEQGQMAILTARYKYPGYPTFSDRLKKLIAIMLSEDPKNRPNIYQVLKDVCSMRGKEVPIKDIYTNRTPSEARNNQKMPTPVPDIKSPPTIGAVQSPPSQVEQPLPNITPMRRGRPTTHSRPLSGAMTNASPARPIGTDPFTALDSNSSTVRAAAVDELSSRFPAVEDFSLLQDKSSRFQFQNTNSPDVPADKRIVNALADEVFAQKTVSRQSSASKSKNSPLVTGKSVPTPPKSSRTLQAQLSESSSREENGSARPKMVSTGTMTSRPPSPEPYRPPPINNRPVWRVPQVSSIIPSTESGSAPRPNHNRVPSSQSSNSLRQDHRSAKSSRPSLEGLRSSYLGLPDSVHRSKSLENRSHASDKNPDVESSADQEVNDYGEQRHTESDLQPGREFAVDDSNIESSLDYLRAKEEEGSSKGRLFSSHHRVESESAVDDSNIDSNVDFLKAMEEEKGAKSLHGRKPSMQRPKHSSMPAIALTNTKNSLAGRFGEAFRRFEAGSIIRRPSSPEEDALVMKDTGRLSPVEAVDSPENSTYTGSTLGETEELSPEMRRELERRQLALEERRVADAAAAYKQRLEGGPKDGQAGGGTSRKASAIQERVKNLLDESGKAAPVKKTAQGYGKYTGSETEDLRHSSSASQPIPVPPATSRGSTEANATLPSSAPAVIHVPSGAPQTELKPAKLRAPPGRPNAPPKPPGLRTGGAGAAPARGGNVALERPVLTTLNINADPDGNDLEDFSKRYPSLSLELVETEIAGIPQHLPERTGGLRVRDV